MFALTELEQVSGKIKFYKLSENGRCLFDEFCSTIEKESNLTSFLDGAWNIMQKLSEGNRLPTHLVKPLRGGQPQEWEIRKGSLRIYFVKHPKGHIIISGGKKNAQNSDIIKFQNTHRRFIESK